jgi:NADH-quinone oxidoreductase subunit M
MLTAAIFLPAAALLAVLLLPRRQVRLIRTASLAAAAASLTLIVWLWLSFDPAGGLQFVDRRAWIPSLGVSYAVGLDGLSLPLVALTAVLFLAAFLFSWGEDSRVKEYHAWFLFLETACLGVFSALDLFLFYVFWDLTLVGMYFIIALWGHEGARAAAFKFFLYTFVGSMALLLGIIGIYLAEAPLTMDMAALAERRPLTAAPGWLRELVFFALLAGFAIKTPAAPLHSWLPPAHVEAPSAGSLILAGILLKMGTYGFFRILLPILPGVAADHALLLIVIGVASVFYGVLAALAQTNVKRLIAYTSVNHMGYIVLAVGAVAAAGGDTAARRLAADGAVLQMVSHGLITGALFLLAGVLWRRAKTFELADFGGLARSTPVFAGAFGFAAFASLGLPGLSGFVAEFQIFVGTFGIVSWAAVVAAGGIVLTAGLFLWTLQRLLLGPMADRWQAMPDMAPHERLAILPLLVLVLAIGLMPWWILEVIGGFGSSLTRTLP